MKGGGLLGCVVMMVRRGRRLLIHVTKTIGGRGEVTEVRRKRV